MSHEVSKNLLCIVMRNGIEVWIDGEKSEQLNSLMEKQRFIKIGNKVLNVRDISGIRYQRNF